MVCTRGPAEPITTRPLSAEPFCRGLGAGLPGWAGSLGPARAPPPVGSSSGCPALGSPGTQDHPDGRGPDPSRTPRMGTQRDSTLPRGAGGAGVRPRCGPRSGPCGRLALEPEWVLSRPTPGIPSAVPHPPRAPAPALAIQPRTQNLPQCSPRCAGEPSSCLCDIPRPPTRVSACENRPCWAYLVPAVWALGTLCLPYGLMFRGRQQTHTRMDHVRCQGGASATRTDGHWDSDATLGRLGRASLRSSPPSRDPDREVTSLADRRGEEPQAERT